MAQALAFLATRIVELRKRLIQQGGEQCEPLVLIELRLHHHTGKLEQIVHGKGQHIGGLATDLMGQAQRGGQSGRVDQCF